MSFFNIFLILVRMGGRGLFLEDFGDGEFEVGEHGGGGGDEGFDGGVGVGGEDA